MSRSHARSIALVLGACSMSIEARAEETVARSGSSGDPVRLSVTGGPGCPDSAAFEARVRARVQFTAARTGTRARQFDVALHAGKGRGDGVLETTAVDGTTAERRVSGRTCDEVATALALVVSVAIDHGDPPTESTDENPPPPATPGSPSATPRTSTPEPASPLLPDARGQEAAAPLRDGRDTVHAEVGADALFMGGVSPTTLVAASPFAGISGFAKALPDPEIRVAFAYASSGVLDTALGTARLTWTVARLDLCPARVSVSANLGVRPCVTVDAGVLHGEGVRVEHPSARSRPWLDIGASLRADAKIIGPLFAEACGSLLFPTVRDDFGIDPGAPLHRAPVVAGAGTAGLALVFP